MMKRFCKLFVLFSFISVHALTAAKVDTVKVYSHSMKKEIKTVVVTPAHDTLSEKLPAVYLLHGYSGNYGSWVNDGSDEVKALSDRHDVIVVCPDGAFGSWYFDSPLDSAFMYETFVSKELVEWVDAHYNTIPSREGRAVTGLSMGGHGGLYLGFRHQDVFGACGSMSGGVDIRPFPDNWDIARRLGKQSEFPKNWEANTVINQLHLLTPGAVKIIIDCGTEDFFYDVNVKLHRELLYRNIPHDFISRPGGHNWAYWANAVKYQFLYFSEYFQSTP